MLKILVTISKKVPGPTDYSSVQASCSIEGELHPGQQAVTEAARLQAQAEQAVDQFLGIGPSSAPHTMRSTDQDRRSANAGGPRTSSPRPAGRSSHRPPAPITENQLRFIERLLAETQTDLGTVLHQQQVGTLRELTCRAAAQLIDSLRAGSRSG